MQSHFLDPFKQTVQIKLLDVGEVGKKTRSQFLVVPRLFPVVSVTEPPGKSAACTGRVWKAICDATSHFGTSCGSLGTDSDRFIRSTKKRSVIFVPDESRGAPAFCQKDW